jgi:hypothetical protein
LPSLYLPDWPVLGARKLPFLRCTLSITHLYTFVGIYLFHIPLPGIHTCLFFTCNKKNCLIKTQNVYTCLTVLCNCERHHRLPSFNFFSVGLPSYFVWPPTPIPRLFPFSSTRVAPIVYSDCKKCFPHICHSAFPFSPSLLLPTWVGICNFSPQKPSRTL